MDNTMFGFNKKEKQNNKVITRFPPSPTGPFHIGSVRTALYNYLFSRQNGGDFILRIEDTDKERSEKKFEDNIFDSLKWLGLEYDGKVLKQSERTEIYKAKLQELISKDLAYLAEAQESDPTKQVVRFRNPNSKIKFQDLVRGEVEIDVSDLKDFVIARNVDEPIYHFTVVVDDLESSVTHVIRGEDHISNTPRQILILEALGGQRPIYAHLPLVLARDKSKLSKRKHGESVSLDFYRKEGYLPEVILNFMALIGWNPGGEQEIFSLQDLIKKFDITKVQKSGAIFNKEKLDWMNKEYLKMIPEEVRNEKIKECLAKKNLGEKISEKVYPIIFDRISKWGDIDSMIDQGELTYYFEDPVPNAELLNKQVKNPSRTVEHLTKVSDLLQNMPASSIDNIEAIKAPIFEYATKEGRGDVLWPLRVALSGKEKSPDPFTLISVKGIASSVSSIRVAIEELKKKE